MGHVDPLLQENLGDQEAPVALSGILLTAHDRHPVALYASSQSLYSGTEIRAGRQLGVQHMPLSVIELRALWATAQPIAQEQVSGSSVAHNSGKPRSIDPFHISGVRPGPHVNENLDFVLAQESLEMLMSMVRMANREQLLVPHLRHGVKVRPLPLR